MYSVAWCGKLQMERGIPRAATDAAGIALWKGMDWAAITTARPAPVFFLRPPAAAPGAASVKNGVIDMKQPPNVLIVDAQGGVIGRQLIAAVRQELPGVRILAVGANGTATAAMLKAGADQGATGENAVVTACRKADVILGPIGIVIADAMLGEITAAMAIAVARSGAKRILIPFDHCDNLIVGVPETSMKLLIKQAVDALRQAIEDRSLT